MRGYAGLDSCAPARGGLFSLRSVRLRATASALLAQPELLAIRRLPWNWRGRAQQTFFSAAHRPANALQAARGLSQTMRGERAHPAGICSQRRGLPFEFMLNALRLTQGFPVHWFSERTGLPIRAIEQPLRTAIARCLLTRDHQMIIPTPLGQRFLSDLQALFLE